MRVSGQPGLQYRDPVSKHKTEQRPGHVTQWQIYLASSRPGVRFSTLGGSPRKHGVMGKHQQNQQNHTCKGFRCQNYQSKSTK
jgi:hypothetical protein